MRTHRLVYRLGSCVVVTRVLLIVYHFDRDELT